MHAVDQAWVKAYNDNDAEGAAKLYDENAMLFPPGAPAMKGRGAIKAFLAADMAASAKEGIKFSLGPNPDGGVSGNLGWVSGTYQVKDKSGKVIESGKYLSVNMKKGGKWYYVRDTWNSDAPPAPAPSPTPAKKK